MIDYFKIGEGKRKGYSYDWITYYTIGIIGRQRTKGNMMGELEMATFQPRFRLQPTHFCYILGNSDYRFNFEEY